MKKTVVQPLIISVETSSEEISLIRRVLQKNHSDDHSFTLSVLRRWLLEFESCEKLNDIDTRTLEDIIEFFHGLPNDTQITFIFQ